MTKQKRITKIVCLALLFLIGGQILLSAFSVRAGAVTQNSFVDSYDNTDINEELKQLGIKKALPNPNGKVEIVAMYEYAYSTDLDNSDFYNLYFYVYNPTQKSIEVNGENKVTIRCFDKTLVSVKKLEYCSSTSDRLYYKFKLQSPKNLYKDMKILCAEKQTESREYNITGIQLIWSGESEYVDNNVSKKYVFSGYAAYCTAEGVGTSTLTSNFSGIDSISLELNSTFYRFASVYGEQKSYEHCDDLTSVYFSVPKKYFDEYGGMNEISTSWYEYITKPIFVTGDPNADEMLEYLNKYSSEIDKSSDYWRVFWELTGGTGGDYIIDNDTYFNKHFNGDSEVERAPGSDDFFGTNDCTAIPKMDWFFRVSNVEKPSDYTISSEALLRYMRDYTRKFPEHKKLLELYSDELFITDESFEEYKADYVVSAVIRELYESGERKLGLNNEVFSNDSKKFEYLDVEKNPTWFESFFECKDISKFEVLPLQFFSENDAYLLSDSDFSEKYFVFSSDVPKVKDFVQDSFSNDEVPVILHFAATEYYASVAMFDKAGNDELSGNDGYVAQESVFLNFDVISLGFVTDEKGVEKTIIGVVASPIDIINALTAPEGLVEDQEWWQKIMMILMIILLVILLVFLGGPLGFIFKVIWTGVKTIISFAWKATCFVIKIPFSILGFIFKRR